MTILITAMALAAAPATAPATPAPAVHAQQAQHTEHAHPAQPGTKPEGKGCCCEKMAGSGKMACCAEHGDGHSGEHGASR